ncbi:aminotransferase class I/II-fold pyridoxal phosphate-dependent enzyme [Methylocucumis oryzae]|uniref:aminotransferase class I/II-fold pyridoxal phosphate-dependent enzyme n=1 Tax=Methylocucumis oryzae TaxID=1632867 RepID=UPI000A63C977|nr:aminotransferase class I/II-fold pyridoxal phosphate-dependent enzyme [Methylocucumis oryzae]
MPPPVAASALSALELLKQEPERVQTLHKNAGYFYQQLKAIGANIGTSCGTAIIPAIAGSSLTAARWSQALFEANINVQPILYPAVPEKSARLRFLSQPNTVSSNLMPLSMLCANYFEA